MTRDADESDAAEARRARAERRRAVREEFEAKQLAKLDAHMEEERERYACELEKRARDEDRGAPPGWTGEIAFGPETTPEVRRAIEGSE